MEKDSKTLLDSPQLLTPSTPSSVEDLPQAELHTLPDSSPDSPFYPEFQDQEVENTRDESHDQETENTGDESGDKKVKNSGHEPATDTGASTEDYVPTLSQKAEIEYRQFNMLFVQQKQLGNKLVESNFKLERDTVMLNRNQILHSGLQDHCIASLPDNVKETIEEQEQANNVRLQDIQRELGTTPVLEDPSREMILVKEAFDVRMQNSMNIDNHIMRSTEVSPAYRESMTNTTAFFSKYEESHLNHLSNVRTGMAIENAIDDYLDYDPHKSSVESDQGDQRPEGSGVSPNSPAEGSKHPAEGSENPTKGPGNPPGGSSSPDEGPEGSDGETEVRSLIDDFADPNLEQPSYMDPED